MIKSSMSIYLFRGKFTMEQDLYSKPVPSLNKTLLVAKISIGQMMQWTEKRILQTPCTTFHRYPCTTFHRYPIFIKRYSVLCKVYTGYCGTSEIEHGLCACTVDAKARDYLSVQANKPCSISHLKYLVFCSY